MPSQTIQWFPGHMAKTRRLITENLSQVDIVIELLDARIPKSSKNPEIDKLLNTKPRLILLTKSSLANAAATKKWETYYAKLAAEKKFSCAALAVDTVTGEGVKEIAPMIRKVLAEKLERYANKGMEGRKIRAMMVGIPNVGKSSLINRLSGGKHTRVEDRPGVTRSKQWGLAVATKLNKWTLVVWEEGCRVELNNLLCSTTTRICNLAADSNVTLSALNLHI